MPSAVVGIHSCNITYSAIGEALFSSKRPFSAVLNPHYKQRDFLSSQTYIMNFFHTYMPVMTD